MPSSIVKYQKLHENKDFRLDAEYFAPIALENDRKIQSLIFETIKDLGCKVVSGPFGSSLKSEAYIDEGVPFIRISNLSDFFIKQDDLIYISEEDNNRLSSSQLNIGDFILSKVGNTIGVVSKVSEEIGNCNISENNIGIKFSKKVKNEKKNFILTFLNCKNGQIQILRRISGNAQPKLNVFDVYSIIIPKFSTKFEAIISLLVENVKNHINQSKTFYQKAENILLAELNLSNWQPEHNLSYIKNFSDIQNAKRIDAEYYQPKYDEIMKAIKNYSNGWDNMDNIASIRKGIEVGSDAYAETGIPFLRISNLNKFEINNNNQQYISEDSYNKLAKMFQPQKGEILLSKDGSPGLAYHLNCVPSKMITSSGILRVNIKNKEYLPEYVTLVLNSLIVQEQIERVSSGAIIKHWLVDQINDTVLPKLKIEKQKEIVIRLQESFKNREQSKRLLEIAKLGVEKAIEENEEAAMNWVNEELKNLGVKI